MNNWSLKIKKCDNNIIGSESEEGGPIQIDLKNVVSILISADFLKIDKLVKECIEYFVVNIEELSKIQVDMSCINSTIVRDMAQGVKIDKLDTLKERKDKLISRLFMKKLEILLEKDKNYLYKCAYCQKLFTKDQRRHLTCSNGKPFINAYG